MGGVFSLQLGLVSPTLERRQKSYLYVQQILLNETVTALEYLQLLGLMASCIELVPFARLHMRPFISHLHFWKPSSRDTEALIPCTQHLQGHLNWWLQEVNITRGKPFLPWVANKVLQTDASLQGWERLSREQDSAGSLISESNQIAHKPSGNGSS